MVDNKLGDITALWPCHHSFGMFVGKSKYGKSYLVTSLLTHRTKKFENIIICIPMHSFTSMAEHSNLFSDLMEINIPRL